MKSHPQKALKPLITATIIALITCAVLLVLLSINGFKNNVFEVKTSDEDTNALPSRLLETPDYGQFYIDNLIFLGDKTISTMRDIAVLRDGVETKQIWTGENNSLSLDYSSSVATIVFPENGEAVSLSEAFQRKRPDYIVITLGFENGVAYCTEEKFKEYYGNLINTIKESSPDTKIILQSVFPVSDKKQKDNSGITNDKIARANTWIEELADSNAIKYLNTVSVLKDSKGNLKPEYDSGDGYTLNTEGYTAVLDYIRTHGYK